MTKLRMQSYIVRSSTIITNSSLIKICKRELFIFRLNEIKTKKKNTLSNETPKSLLLEGRRSCERTQDMIYVEVYYAL